MQSIAREEKLLGTSLDSIIQRVQDVKNSISTLLFKLEHEYQTISWPSMLDSFALLSGQISSLHRLLKSDKMPDLRNRVFFPCQLCADRDEELEKLTEGRVFAFNHEVVPDYLRTKPEPAVEEKMAVFQTKAQQCSPETLQKHINTLNKVSNNVIEIINKSRDEWEAEINQKCAQPQTVSQADTNLLLSAIATGKGLKSTQQMKLTASQGASQHPNVDPRAQHQQGGQPGMHPKAPSTIRTNIKSANTMHPYSRP